MDEFDRMDVIQWLFSGLKFHFNSALLLTPTLRSHPFQQRWLLTVPLSWVYDVRINWRVSMCIPSEKWKISCLVSKWRVSDAGKDWGQEKKVDGRGWDGWLASLTQWTWVWANSGRHWRTEKPSLAWVHEVPKSQTDWATEQQHSHERLQPPLTVSGWAPREIRKEKNTCHLAAIRLQPLPMVSPENMNTGYWPQIAEVHIKRMVSMSPDSCIFSYIEKCFTFSDTSCILPVSLW